jgi:hypothetical protein
MPKSHSKLKIVHLKMATLENNELKLNQCVSKGVINFWIKKTTKLLLVALSFTDIN